MQNTHKIFPIAHACAVSWGVHAAGIRGELGFMRRELQQLENYEANYPALHQWMSGATTVCASVVELEIQLFGAATAIDLDGVGNIGQLIAVLTALKSVHFEMIKEFNGCIVDLPDAPRAALVESLLTNCGAEMLDFHTAWRSELECRTQQLQAIARCEAPGAIESYAKQCSESMGELFDASSDSLLEWYQLHLPELQAYAQSAASPQEHG